MIPFTYSFCMAMLHSFWQAALLVLLYIMVDKVSHPNSAPLAKRNFLYLAILAQLILFVITFSLYFFSNEGSGMISSAVQNITHTLGSERIKMITPWVFSGYIFMITFKLVQAVYNWHQFKQLYKTGLQKPGVDLKLFTEIKAHQFGIKRKIKLWLSHSVQTPLTFGYFKPIILLPVALINNISPRQAETLILHELTHIRTHDYLLNWFLVIAETLFFFNPFITGLCKKIKLEREKHCDLNVVSFEYSPAVYAETLVLAERMKQMTPVFQMAAVNRKKYLLERIRFFTSEKVINQTLRFNIVAPLVGLVLLFLFSTAILFQSQGSISPISDASGFYLLPTDGHLLSNTEISTPFLTETTKNKPLTETGKNIIQDVKPKTNPASSLPPFDQQPEIEAEIEPIPVMNLARTVTTPENDAARQIIITEQGSSGATVKVYTLVFDNGKWILQPELVLDALKMMNDSLSLKVDSLQRDIKKIYPDQQ